VSLINFSLKHFFSVLIWNIPYHNVSSLFVSRFYQLYYLIVDQLFIAYTFIYRVCTISRRRLYWANISLYTGCIRIAVIKLQTSKRSRLIGYIWVILRYWVKLALSLLHQSVNLHFLSTKLGINHLRQLSILMTKSNASRQRHCFAQTIWLPVVLSLCIT